MTIPDKPPRRRSFAAFLVVFVVLVCVGVAVAHRPIIEWWIVREARARGIELEFASVSIAPERIVLHQTHARLEGVPGLDARFVELAIDVRDTTPIRLNAKESFVEISGSVPEVGTALAGFAARHADLTQLPVTADGTLVIGTRQAPQVLLNGHADLSGDGDLVYTGKLEVSKTNLGKVNLHRSKEGLVDVAFGVTNPERLLLKVSLDTAARPMKVSGSFASMKVEELVTSLGYPVPRGFESAFVEGNLSLVMAGETPNAAHQGTASLVLSGWVPPHPRELDGIVFGTKTKLGATFDVPVDLSEARITKATVEAGALRLEGKGNVVRQGLSARAKLDLAGNIPCSELGASAIGSHVQGLLGSLLRGVARAGVGGTVKIHVTVDADTKALSQAKIEQTVDLGCRLR